MTQKGHRLGLRVTDTIEYMVLPWVDFLGATLYPHPFIEILRDFLPKLDLLGRAKH